MRDVGGAVYRLEHPVLDRQYCATSLCNTLHDLVAKNAFLSIGGFYEIVP